MAARVAVILIAAALALAGWPASADVLPPDGKREVPIPAPRPDPAPTPVPAPQPPSPKPTAPKASSTPFIAIGFAAMFALLWLWFRSRERLT